MEINAFDHTDHMHYTFTKCTGAKRHKNEYPTNNENQLDMLMQASTETENLYQTSLTYDFGSEFASNSK